MRKLPFLYFISHSEPKLIEKVRKGRRADFAEYQRQGEPPDPQAEETFQRSKIHHSLAEAGEHRELREFYKELIRLRKCVKPLSVLSKDHMEVSEVHNRMSQDFRVPIALVWCDFACLLVG